MQRRQQTHTPVHKKVKPIGFESDISEVRRSALFSGYLWELALFLHYTCVHAFAVGKGWLNYSVSDTEMFLYQDRYLSSWGLMCRTK
jgi:hypothetical protein